jgi:hypothetical protein
MPVKGGFAPEAASRDSTQTMICFSEVEIARQMGHVRKVQSGRTPTQRI